MTKKDCIAIMCPPYPEYPEYPKDQSHSELFDCPECNKKMWLSEKKRGHLLFSSCLGKDILLACYDCIKKIAKEEAQFFDASEMERI